jgi:hypothetical protein
VNTSGHVFKWNGTTWPDFGGNTCEGSVPVCARHDQYGTSTIGVGPTDTSAWIIDCAGSGGNYYIRQWSGTCWQLMDGMATQVAVDPQGNPWVINSLNSIYRRVSGAWQAVSGAAISISAWGGTIAVIGTDNNRYVWNSSQFTLTAGRPAGITPTQVYNGTVMDSLGRIWDLSPGVVKGRGDITGDKRTDIALLGGSGWNAIPIAISTGGGSFNAVSNVYSTFANWAQYTGAQAVSGDFNGDGMSDIALVGGAGWTSIPVALSNGDGTFAPPVNVTTTDSTNFETYAHQGGKAIAGDFNGDGFADIALTGPAGWSTIPIAFSNGDGTFSVTNGGTDYSYFPSTWASTAGVQIMAGDFDRDGKSDIALTGPAGWGSIPVAFSNGDGSWHITNNAVATFPGRASAVRPDGSAPLFFRGDFNGDGYSDIAILGGNGWTDIPIAYGAGGGNFVYGASSGGSNTWLTSSIAQTPAARVVTGDFDGDGTGDLAFVGPTSWTTLPVGISNGDGTFGATNQPISAWFMQSAGAAGVKVVAGY